MVDRECDKYHKEKGLPIRDDLSYVRKLSSNELELDKNEVDIDTRLQKAAVSIATSIDSETAKVKETYEEELERLKRSSVSSGKVNI